MKPYKKEHGMPKAKPQDGKIGEEVAYTLARNVKPNAYVERIPTGMPSLDKAIGGGYPKGSVTVFAAAEGTGKTTILLQTVANILGDSYDGHRCIVYSEEMDEAYIQDTLLRQLAGPYNLSTAYKGKDGRAVNVGVPYVYDDVAEFLIDYVMGDNLGYVSGVNDFKKMMEFFYKAADDGFDVFFVDNLMTLTETYYDTDTTDTNAIQSHIIHKLTELAVKKQVAVVLVAHTAKGSQTAAPDQLNDKISGSAATKNKAGLIMQLTSATHGEGKNIEKSPDHRVITITKRRYTEGCIDQGPIMLKYDMTHGSKRVVEEGRKFSSPMLWEYDFRHEYITFVPWCNYDEMSQKLVDDLHIKDYNDAIMTRYNNYQWEKADRTRAKRARECDGLSKISSYDVVYRAMISKDEV